MLQTKFDYKYMIFTFDAMMVLFHTGGVKDAVLSLIEELFVLIKDNTIVNAELFYNTAFLTKSGTYTGSLWSLYMLSHIFGEAGSNIFNSFHKVLDNTVPASIAQLSPTCLGNLEHIRQTNSGSFENLRHVDHRTNIVPMNLAGTFDEIAGIDDISDVDLSEFDIPAAPTAPTAPTPEKIGMATVIEKIFIEKTHMFDNVQLNYMVEKTNGGIYAFDNGLVDLVSIKNIMMLAAQIHKIEEANFDVLCDKLYKVAVYKKL